MSSSLLAALRDDVVVHGDMFSEDAGAEPEGPHIQGAMYLLETYFAGDTVSMLTNLVRMGVACSACQVEIRDKLAVDAEAKSSLDALEAFAALEGGAETSNEVEPKDVAAICALAGVFALLTPAERAKWPASAGYFNSKASSAKVATLMGPHMFPGTVREGGMIDMAPVPKVVAAASAYSVGLNQGAKTKKTQRQMEKKVKEDGKKKPTKPAKGEESKGEESKGGAKAGDKPCFPEGCDGISATAGKDARIACIEKALGALGIAFERSDHVKVHTMEDMVAAIGGLGGIMCKNLFLKAKKKHPKREGESQVWLVVAANETKVDLKQLTKALGYPSKGELRMGKDDLLCDSLQVVQGEVTPLALINDAACVVNVVLDKAVAHATERVWFHPLSSEASVGASPPPARTSDEEAVASTGPRAFVQTWSGHPNGDLHDLLGALRS